MDVVADVADVACELEEAGVAIRVVDRHSDIVDEAAREVRRNAVPVEFLLASLLIHSEGGIVRSAGCRNEEEHVIELKKVQRQGMIRK